MPFLLPSNLLRREQKLSVIGPKNMYYVMIPCIQCCPYSQIMFYAICGTHYITGIFHVLTRMLLIIVHTISYLAPHFLFLYLLDQPLSVLVFVRD